MPAYAEDGTSSESLYCRGQIRYSLERARDKKAALIE